MTEQVLTTDDRKKGFKRVLKLLSLKKRHKQDVVRKLTIPVKVKTENGSTVEKNPIYDNSRYASELVKDLVKSDKFPIKVDGKYLVREDLEKRPGDK